MSFYRFSQFTGRIARASQQYAYSPQGLNASVVETAPAQFGSSAIKGATVAEPQEAATIASAKGTHPADAGYMKVLALQKEWNVDDGKLVWQKRGAMDSVPMGITYAIMVAGLAYGFSLLWSMSWPKPVEES